MVLTLLLLLTAFAVLVYYCLTKTFSQWRGQNIPCEPKPIPIFGHLFPLFVLRDNFGTLLQKLYQKMGKNSMYGCYVMQTPAVLLRDPELIKQVLQTDFDSFANNLATLHQDLDPILRKNPFFAKDKAWEESRALLTKNQSGRKLKCLLVLVNKVCNQLVNFVDRQDSEKFEAKLLFSRVTAEIIANATFGIDGANFEDEIGKDAFINIPEKVFNLDKVGGLEQIIRFFLPNVADFMGISVAPRNINSFIKRQLRDYIKLHKSDENNDFLQFSVEDVETVDEDMLMAQATSILFDGYEGISNCLAFMFYRMSENLEIQEKAREEVNEVLERFNGRITSESLKQMTYLEQIINEVLRLNPSFGDITRVCNHEITLKGYDGLECKLKPGDMVLISASGVHFDPEFWPDPERFDPERFDAVGNSRRNKFTYFGFGNGPRVCPGRRMGVMIVRAVASTLLRNYRVDLSDKMKGPLKLNKNTFASNIDGGVWLNIKRLNNNDCVSV